MNFGPILIMASASLWAVDALIRTPLTKSLTPASIVFWEHLVGFIVLLPLFFRSRKEFSVLTRLDWLNILILTIVSSVAGTILFTAALGKSFATGDFITPLLLQKTQPLMVILLSAIFLKERLTKHFLWLAPVAIIGSYLMSFGTDPIKLQFAGKELIYALAIGAAACWGSGTIFSKLTLRKLSYPASTSIRFLVAIPISFVAILLLDHQSPFISLGSEAIIRFVFIALSTGAVALLIYYRGLAQTEARVSTMAELAFPFVSLLIAITPLNPYGAPQILSSANITGIILLLSSVLYISLESVLQKHIARGIVIHGSGDGKKLGFPTANIALDHQLTIPYGVYAGKMTIKNKKYNGIIHYGPRLIFGEQKPLFEVHLFDFSSAIYGQTVTVELGKFIRPTRNFKTTSEMVNQIDADIKSVKLNTPR